MAVTTITAPAQYIYSTEQAVIDQIRNGNRPFSRDFSIHYKSPKTTIVGLDSAELLLPFAYLPHPGVIPYICYSADLLINIRQQYNSEAPAHAAYKVHLRGTNDNTTIVETETPSAINCAITAVLTTGAAIAGWNKGANTSNHHLLLTRTISAYGGENATLQAEVSIVGVHSILG